MVDIHHMHDMYETHSDLFSPFFKGNLEGVKDMIFVLFCFMEKYIVFKLYIFHDKNKNKSLFLLLLLLKATFLHLFYIF